MNPTTIVYVTDMTDSVDFYRRLVPNATVVSSSPHWTELSVGSASIAMHLAEQVSRGSQLGLAFTADAPLEQIKSTLTEQGIRIVRDIADEPFGRSLVIQDPDDLSMQINEHASDLYPG